MRKYSTLSILFIVIFLSFQLGLRAGDTLEVQYLVQNWEIDGFEDEWDEIEKVPIATLANSTSEPDDESDFSAYFKSAWDNENFYLLIKIKDESLNSDIPASSKFWNNDGIELFFDMSNHKTSEFLETDRKYFFTYNYDLSAVKLLTGKNADFTGVKYVQTSSSSGYTMEISFPIETLGVIENVNDQVFGLDIFVSDNDDPGNVDGLRETIYAWSGDGEPKPNNSTVEYGNLKLTGNPNKSPYAYIKEFSFKNLESNISTVSEGILNGNAITLYVPKDVTDITELIPEINISSKATIEPALGISQDFSEPVSYTVTSENGCQQEYIVHVKQSKQDIILVSEDNMIRAGNAGDDVINNNELNITDRTIFEGDLKYLFISYLRFNLTNVTQDVDKAILRMKIRVLYWVQGKEHGVNIFATNSDWDESTLTYNTAPDVGKDEGVLIDNIEFNHNEYENGDIVEVDITSAYNAAKGGYLSLKLYPTKDDGTHQDPWPAGWEQFGIEALNSGEANAARIIAGDTEDPPEEGEELLGCTSYSIAKIISSSLGSLDEQFISDIPEGTTVTELINGLVLADGCSAIVLDSKGGSEIVDTDTEINASMVIEVSSNPNDVKEYSISVLTEIDELHSFSKISISPNPADSYLNIQGLNNSDELIIYSITGTKILNLSSVDASNLQLRLKDFNNGIYFVQIIRDNNSKCFKFIKR